MNVTADIEITNCFLRLFVLFDSDITLILLYSLGICKDYIAHIMLGPLHGMAM